MVVYPLEDGEYFIDITYTLKASYGEVEFVSDNVHYAWPFLRIHPKFSGQNGDAKTGRVAERFDAYVSNLNRFRTR